MGKGSWDELPLLLLPWLQVSGSAVREGRVHAQWTWLDLQVSCTLSSVSSWDFVSLQGWVLARLCGAKFQPCLLVGRGPVPNKVLWEVSGPAAPMVSAFILLME